MCEFSWGWACMLSHSVVSDSATPWTVAHQAPLSMGFPRQGYWSELPFPTAGDLPNPGIEAMSLASPTLAGGFFTIAPPGKPHRFSIFLGIYPGVGFLGHMVTLSLIFQGSTRLFSKVAASFLQSLQQSMGVPMAPYPCQHLLLLSFDPERCRGSSPMLSLTQSETFKS